MTPEHEEALKLELDGLVTQLDVELCHRKTTQLRARVEEIRAQLNPAPKPKVRKRRGDRRKIKLNMLKD